MPEQVPLGTRVPQSPHAVCVSIPTMKDVVGYEEKDPDTIAKISTGYPRFCKHFFISEVEEIIKAELGINNRNISLFASPVAAEEAVVFTRCKDVKIELYKGIDFVHYPEDDKIHAQFCTFIQHTGTGISSRHAEDFLVKNKKLNKHFTEKESSPTETIHLNAAIADILKTDEKNVLVTSSGMNAFYAAFKCIRRYQRNKKKKVWIQLGWLYLDTICILEKCLYPDEECIKIHDIHALNDLKEILNDRGAEIAGIVTEIPTNPLIQSSNIIQLYELCKKYDIALIIDPTISSIYNISVLSHCDILVTSLTKYAGNQGDVMAGCLALNPGSPIYQDIQSLIKQEFIPLYIRDQSRLHYQLAQAPEIVKKINQNTLALVKFLQSNKNIGKVFWSLEEKSSENYLSFTDNKDKVGGVISFYLKNISLQEFYDRITILKSPSFGTHFTLLCPFMYLAHYDLVSQPGGRAYLKSIGIDPDLIRVSVGTEDTEEIITQFQQALE